MTMLGVTGPAHGPNVIRTKLRTTDPTGATSLVDGIACLTCGWSTPLPDGDVPGERPLFTDADLHSPADCARHREEVARRG